MKTLKESDMDETSFNAKGGEEEEEVEEKE